MRIDGIFLPDVPVLSAALSDDLVLVVQRSGLLVQSYQNLTSTYYAIAGEIKIPGINLPTVRIATSQPTDELVLIVENSGLAVKQIGFNAPVMSDGSKIAVPGIGIPSVRFSGTIDGDEYVLAVRANNLCLIPIPSSFSAGALPTAGQTFYASLKTSLAPEVGTGGPTWSRATKAWGFNELGYLEELASGCAFFGGARLVRNTVRTTSEDFSNAAWTKSNLTVTGTNGIVCANSTSQQFIYQSSSGTSIVAGQVLLCCVRLKYVSGGADFVQIAPGSSGFGTGQYATISLLDGSTNVVGCTATATLVAADTYDFCVRLTATATGAFETWNVCFVGSLAAGRIPNFVGDGVKSFELLRAWSVDVTNYDASYVPEYVSVGVEASPYFGAGIDGAKYFETDWQGAPIPVANLTRLRKETAATNVLLWSRNLSQHHSSTYATKRWQVVETVGAELLTNNSFDSGLTGWTTTIGSGGSITATGGQCTFVSDGGTVTTLENSYQLIAGETYVITIIASGTGSVKLGNNTVEITGFGSGTSTISFVAGSTQTFRITRTSGIACNLVFDSISCKLAGIKTEQTATGLDGIANSASCLTARADNTTILQAITLASAARCASAYVLRKTGTGTISFTQDGGSTWTDITSQINSSTWSRVQITATLANPSVGFKISTLGDAIDVDCVQNEAGAEATSPIVTTTATVNRSADSLTDQTSSNWSDTAGTAYILAKPVVYSGGAVGSATNGLLLSASNSGATAYDGTNSANGPTGTPGAVEKLALAWGSSTMSVASSGLVGTPGTYDGAMGLSSIGVGVGAVGYFGDVAIYNYKMTDAELQAITT